MLKLYYLKISDFQSYSDDVFSPFVGEETCVAVRSYANAVVRRMKLLGEMLVRRKIQELWGLGERDYTFSKGEHGKPYVKGHKGVFFNLSHSGDYLIAGFSDTEIGVDIERIKGERMEVARRFFHFHEIQCLEQLSGKEREELFFRYWSAKESFLKYTGRGLTVPLSDFEVLFTFPETCITFGSNREAVFLKECLIDKAYKSFICSGQNENPELLEFEFK